MKNVNVESEKILTDLKERKEYKKQSYEFFNNKKVLAGAMLSAFLAGAAVGEAEVLVNGADSLVPVAFGALTSLTTGILNEGMKFKYKQDIKICESRIKKIEQKNEMKM